MGLWPLDCWDCGYKFRRVAWMSVCCECCVLSGSGLCVALITRPEESYRVWCVFECDREASIPRRDCCAMKEHEIWVEKTFLKSQKFFSQEIPRILRHPKVHHRFHNNPALVPILSHIHPVHALPTEFLKIHFNVFPSTPRSSEWSLPIRAPHTTVFDLLYLIRAAWPTDLIRLDL